MFSLVFAANWAFLCWCQCVIEFVELYETPSIVAILAIIKALNFIYLMFLYIFFSYRCGVRWNLQSCIDVVRCFLIFVLRSLAFQIWKGFRIRPWWSRLRQISIQSGEARIFDRHTAWYHVLLERVIPSFLFSRLWSEFGLLIRQLVSFSALYWEIASEFTIQDNIQGIGYVLRYLPLFSIHCIS